MMESPETEIIFHDADYDLRMLDRDYGYHANRIFDTRIAAQLLNEPGIGLAALLEKYLGVKLDKKYQRADWSRRPLIPEMLSYAAMDTKHLPELRDILRGAAGGHGKAGMGRGGVRVIFGKSGGLREMMKDSGGSRVPSCSRATASRSCGSCTSGATSLPGTWTGRRFAFSTMKRCSSWPGPSRGTSPH